MVDNIIRILFENVEATADQDMERLPDDTLVSSEPSFASMYEAAFFIVKTLQDNGYEAVYAGGCVRDMLIGKTPNDIDIASSATPDAVESLFDKTIPIGKSFGIIVVIVAGHEFEVATFRSEGIYSDGRRPDSIEFASMEKDAGRRDFTINGMFWDPIKGALVDYVGGESDLKNGILQFIGDPYARIEEDRLRILRGIRFSIRFGFELGEETFNAIKTNAGRIHDVSQERITQEIVKIFEAGKPRYALHLLDLTGLLAEVLPDVAALKGVKQDPVWHPEGDVFEHTIRVMENLIGKSMELQFAGLLHDIGKPATTEEGERITSRGHATLGAEMAVNTMRKMRFSTSFVDTVSYLIKHHMDILSILDARKSTQRKFIANLNYPLLRELYIADKKGSSNDLSGLSKLDAISDQYKQQPAKPSPFITGRDLISIGFKPGEKLGKIKNAIYDKQLEGDFNCYEDALEYAKSLIKQ